MEIRCPFSERSQNFVPVPSAERFNYKVKKIAISTMKLKETQRLRRLTESWVTQWNSTDLQLIRSYVPISEAKNMLFQQY